MRVGWCGSVRPGWYLGPLVVLAALAQRDESVLWRHLGHKRFVEIWDTGGKGAGGGAASGG